MIAEFLNLSITFWIAAIALHLWACFRTSRLAAQFGRGTWKWFFISLFITVIPLAVVLWIDYIRIKMGRKMPPSADAVDENNVTPKPQPETQDRNDSPVTLTPISCPHCHATLIPGMINSSGPVRTCLKCGLPIGDDRLA